jgi:ATP-dependent Clp protease ATP-binding subunit ClpC
MIDINALLHISVSRREVYTVRLPGLHSEAFRGTSLASLMDDAALYLMEHVPQERPGRMPLYEFCPHVELRRVKVEVELHGPGQKKKPVWTGRFAVVVRRWEGDDFYTCVVPAVGTEMFAVERTAYLPEALSEFLAKAAGRLHLQSLKHWECGSYDYLEVVEVEVELPTVLPNRKRRRKRKKKKATEPVVRKRRMVYPRALREVAVNLMHKAIDGNLTAAFGRDRIVEEVLGKLRLPGAAVLLVGPPGSGKTAIVHEVVRRLAAEEQPLKSRTDVWAVDGNRLISGMSYVGGWEQRCKDMVYELSERLDVLYVADLPTLAFTGRSAESDSNMAEYLEPHLGRAEIRILGECAAERLEAVREEAPGFFSRFHIIQVAPMADREALVVLARATRNAEKNGSAQVDPEVLTGILGLTRRFERRAAHPGKAVRLLHRLLSDEGRIEVDTHGRRSFQRSHLVDFFSRETGLPRYILWEADARRHDEILAHFEERIIGQPEATSTLANLVTTLQQGLGNPDRPLATLLFVGPTGVGKTETAKALARWLFGAADRLLRFDMSEFRHPLDVARLVGNRLHPDGELTRRVEQRPFSVVLFDEIEKADPSVFDTLLQVLGEGRLTNAAGRTTDFCNTVVIMTSNLGVRESNRDVGFGGTDIAGRALHYRRAVEAYFRPEFVGRIDNVVAFRSLERADLGPLVRRVLLDILSRRGLRRSGVLVNVEDELVELLVDQGFEPEYGARSLRRVLERRLTVPLAAQLVEQPPQARTTLVHLFRAGEEVGMTVTGLSDAATEPLGTVGPAPDWPALQARFEAVQAGIRRLAEDDEPPVAQARTELLGRVNPGAPGQTPRTTEWMEFHTASELIEKLRELERAADAFDEGFMTAYVVTERLTHEPDPDSWTATRTVVREEHHAHTLDRQLLLRRAGLALLELELQLAAAQYRAQVFGRAESLTIRITPAADDSASRQLARLLATEMSEWASTWGEASLWQCVDSWVPRGQPEDPATGWGLRVSGFGIRRLLEPELGYHLRTRVTGPDVSLELIRIEVVGDGVDAVAELTDWDRQLAQWRRARRDGEGRPDPRPVLRVVRRFQDWSWQHPDADIKVRCHTGMAEDLHRLTLLRLHGTDPGGRENKPDQNS